MYSLVIYSSRYGNTRAIAETIAGELASFGKARLVEAGSLSVDDFGPADLVIMGAPTYRMNLPEEVRAIFEIFPRRILKGRAVAAFDTSYAMSSFLALFTASHPLIQKLRKLGGKPLLPPETFAIAKAHEGPLLEGEIDRAKRWTGDIITRLTRD